MRARCSSATSRGGRACRAGYRERRCAVPWSAESRASVWKSSAASSSSDGDDRRGPWPPPGWPSGRSGRSRVPASGPEQHRRERERQADQRRPGRAWRRTRTSRSPRSRRSVAHEPMALSASTPRKTRDARREGRGGRLVPARRQRRGGAAQLAWVPTIGHGPDRGTCARTRPSASSPTSPCPTTCWPSCSTSPASRRAAATASRGTSRWCRTGRLRRQLADLCRPVQAEYIAIGMTGVTPFAVAGPQPDVDRARPRAQPGARRPRGRAGGAGGGRRPGVDRDDGRNLDRATLTGGASVYPFVPLAPAGRPRPRPRRRAHHVPGPGRGRPPVRCSGCPTTGRSPRWSPSATRRAGPRSCAASPSTSSPPSIGSTARAFPSRCGHDACPQIARGPARHPRHPAAQAPLPALPRPEGLGRAAHLLRRGRAGQLRRRGQGARRPRRDHGVPHREHGLGGDAHQPPLHPARDRAARPRRGHRRAGRSRTS